MSVLRLKNVHKRFRLHLQGGAEIPVHDSASLEVAAGECVVLAGPSGAGKSTLLRLVYGNYRTLGGEIWIQHQGRQIDLASAPPREILAIRRMTLGYVSQFLRCLPRLAAEDVVAEPLQQLGVEREAARARAQALLTRLNLPARLHGLPPATFSGGEQQRVNIARGFAPRYPILLLDEPTASLDATNRALVVDLIREAKASGTAILGVFHDQDVRDAVADRLVDLDTQQAAA